MTGTPWTGEVAARETTTQIMTREKTFKLQNPEPEFTEVETTPPDRKHLRQNPGSPNVPQFPNNGGQRQMEAVQTFAAQTPSTSFTGATLAETSAFPPDSMGAAGPTQYLLCVNNRLKVFDKNTGALGVLNTSTNTFFQSVRNGSGTSDPRIRYDRLSGRWFILIINVSTPNRMLLAVSDSGTITASTVWSFFFFQQNLVTPAGDDTCLSDYPTLGIDANALYIGVNQFCGAGLSYNGTAAFVVRKSSVLGAGPIVVTAFRNLTGSPGGSGPYTPQGVDNYDPAATEGYFIGSDNATYGTLTVRRVLDPGGTPSISANIFITVPATASPITVPHQGNTGGVNGQLDSLDDRLFAAHIRNGRLWTAHNIGVDNNGVANNGTQTRNGARWYEIANLNTATPTLVQSGTLFTSSVANTSDQRSYWIPSVMVSGQGHMALGCSIAGISEFANAATAGRFATDPLGTLQAPVALTGSSTAYNPPGDSGSSRGARRWGDYSYTSLDPCDDMTMWTVQEFCDSTNSYGVRVVKLQAPPPATPVSANPTTIPQNTASFNITITGTQSAGSGFYDPGNGFGCRISATVSGGVTVNSVTYQNPTTVVLNVSTVGASTGAKNVTITNPDGQSITTNSLISVASSGCSYSLNPTSQNFSATGGSGSVTVNTTTGCAWNAVSNDPSFLSITSGSSGTGSGTVNYSVTANSGAARAGTLTVAGQTFTVNQDGATPTCSYAISLTSRIVSSTSGNGSVSVTAPAGCAWTATSNAPWLTISAGSSGSGNGTVSYAVAANSSSAQRQGTLTVAGQTFTVTQVGSGCVTSTSPDTASFPTTGGTLQLRINALVGCNWTITNAPSWVSLSKTTGTGAAKVNYTVAANSGDARHAYLIISGQVHTIDQDGTSGPPPPPPVCTYSLSATTQNFQSAGGSGSVNVTTASGCGWTAVSNAAWVSITGGASSTGSSTASFSVAANSSSTPRSGTLTIAGQTFTVTQDGATPTCSYAINPTSQNFAASGGSGSTNVTTTSGCAWTAASNDAWITITLGSSGTGSGSVTFSVNANQSTSPRQGTLTIAGQTFTVTQDGRPQTCSYSILPTSQNIGSGISQGTVSVMADSSCAWTAVSNVSWIRLVSGASGMGNGIVSYKVLANSGPRRTGTMTIAGQTFTITQAGIF